MNKEKPIKDIESLKKLDLQLKSSLEDTIKYYQTALITAEEASRLIYEGFKQYKKQYIKCF